jgi:hypothetical protein
MSEPEEVYLTTTEATKQLGISQYKMAKLLKEGTLIWYPDPLNQRTKLIKQADVERLLASRPQRRVSAAPTEVPSDRLPA